MVTLLMFSGGLDSTYALVKLLRDTDDEVLAHHIRFVSQLRRHAKENEACEKIVAYCRENYRDFSFTESIIDRRRFLSHGRILLIAGNEAGIVAGSYHLVNDGKRRVDRWTYGLCVEELAPPNLFRLADEICKACCEGFVDPPPELFNLPGATQREQVEFLDQEVLNMTWSCRTPFLRSDGEIVPCGECRSCKRLEPVSEFLPRPELF